jgi:hypothetical protein
MNQSLLIGFSCLLAAAATAQSKTQTTPKIPQNGYYPSPTTALLVGGSDDCSTAAAADAITAAMSPIAVTTVGATNGAPDAAGCVNTNLDVWFYYTASVTGQTTVASCGGVTADSVVTVWADGSPAGACPTTSVACNDDACSLQSSVTFCTNAGESFFIQWGAFGAATTYSGTFTITETPTVEVGNDACAAPLAISGSGPFAFDTSTATTGCQGQGNSLCLSFGTTGISNDAWFTWTPSVGGSASLTTCGMTTPVNGDTKVAIYDGSGCPMAAAIACNDDAGGTACPGGGLNSLVTWPTVCGNTYTIQLGTFPGSGPVSGTFTIAETGSACSPSVEKCGNGDALRIPCPCGNNGTDPNAGCANSVNPAGASLSTSGTVAADDVVLSSTGMSGTVCIFFREDGRIPGGVQFGDGIKCGGGSLLRLRAITYPSGITSVAQFPVPPETITLSARSGTFPGSGVTHQYGCFYRNAAAAFCPPFTFNTTDTEEITW